MKDIEIIKEKLEEALNLAEASRQIATNLMTKITDGIQEILDEIDEIEDPEEDEEDDQ